MIKIGIYKITSPSNKIYVGQATNINKRWNNSYKLLNCKSQPKLYNSLKKYGPENHKFEIIEEIYHEDKNFLKEQLLEKEIYYKQLELTKVNNDWNQVLFLQLNDEKGGYRSKEVKDKISKANLGTKKPKSKEFGKQVSERLKGNQYTKGFKHSEESRQKLSNSLKGQQHLLGYKFTDEQKVRLKESKKQFKIPVYCPELDKSWEGITDCSNDLKLSIGIISHVLYGRSKKTRNGLTFKVKR